jgi:hypothetical protein
MLYFLPEVGVVLRAFLVHFDWVEDVTLISEKMFRETIYQRCEFVLPKLFGVYSQRYAGFVYFLFQVVHYRVPILNRVTGTSFRNIWLKFSASKNVIISFAGSYFTVISLCLLLMMVLIV